LAAGGAPGRAVGGDGRGGGCGLAELRFDRGEVCLREKRERLEGAEVGGLGQLERDAELVGRRRELVELVGERGEERAKRHGLGLWERTLELGLHESTTFLHEV